MKKKLDPYTIGNKAYRLGDLKDKIERARKEGKDWKVKKLTGELYAFTSSKAE